MVGFKGGAKHFPHNFDYVSEAERPFPCWLFSYYQFVPGTAEYSLHIIDDSFGYF